MPIINFIAEAKRIADLYGTWYKDGDPNRKEKLNKLLKNTKPDKVAEKARSLIKFRYNE